MNSPEHSHPYRTPALDAITRLRLSQRRAKNREPRTPIQDWATVRTHLVANAPSAEDETRILHARALDLARPVATIVPDRAAETSVVLRRNSTQFALPIGLVREIVPVETITWIPGVPPFIVGVVNVRGKVLTLVDIELFLRQNSSASAITPPSRSVVVIELANVTVGLVCDGFPDIGEYHSVSVKDVAQVNLPYRTTYIAGIDPHGILLLDLTGLTTDPDFLINEE